MSENMPANMPENTSVFLAREYLVSGGGLVRLDREVVFFSLEEAERFLETLRRDNHAVIAAHVLDRRAVADSADYLEAVDVDFRHEIVEYRPGRTDGWRRRLVYDMRGRLLEEDGEDQDERSKAPPVFTRAFAVGDLVFLRPNVDCPASPSIGGAHAVVAEVREDDPDDRHYVVYYIAEDGRMDHWHVLEEVLTALEEPLPEALLFLSVLSDFFHNRGPLREDTLYEIMNEDVFVLNTRRYDLARGEILAGKTPKEVAR